MGWTGRQVLPQLHFKNLFQNTDVLHRARFFKAVLVLNYAVGSI